MKSLLTRVSMLLVATALVAGPAGCSKKPKNLTPLPAQRSGSGAPTGDVPLESGTPGAGRLPGSETGVGATDLGGGGFGTGGTGLNDSLDSRNKLEDHDLLAADTIYFDFDKSNVKPQYSENITRVADYLRGHPSDALLVEGHCDERGTPDYNLALGERRAQSVREKLMAAGISGDRITTISYGEEKPAVMGNTEADYAKNRRAVFVVLMPPGGVR